MSKAEERFELSVADHKQLSFARDLLVNLIRAEVLFPAQLVSAAKLWHVIRRLPLASSEMEVELKAVGPWVDSPGTHVRQWWVIEADGSEIEIWSGGEVAREGAGAVTFLTTRWTARPGEDPTFEDHREKLAPVPGLMGFDESVRAFDFRTTGFEIKIKDPANALLWEPTQDAVDDWGPDAEGDEGEAADENQGEENPVCERDWSVIPRDEAETRVAALVHADEVDCNEPGISEGVSECDICGSKLDGKGLFVDGRRRDVALWANMCAACYEQRGAGVGWGVGQLYARQADGSWRMVAGFRD